MKLLIFCFIFSLSTFSQENTFQFHANIIDASFNALAYSNISIKNKTKTNTVSNKDGHFVIECRTSDTLIINHVGYKKQEISVSVLLSNKTFMLQRNILLTEKIQLIREVQVITEKKKYRYKNYGNKSKDKAFLLEADSKGLAYEFGVKINIPESKNVKLEKFNCYIVRSTADSLKFRLNIYHFKNKDSSLNLLNNNIIIQSKIKSGIIEVNLKKERIFVKGDVLVTLEVIEFFGEGNVSFSTGTLSGGTYWREGKEENWEKFPIIGLAFNLDAKVSRRNR
tara:strand:- start:16095 stop:16937 length:843 start_codon:yes stop_codon:yes gene_type:complete